MLGLAILVGCAALGLLAIEADLSAPAEPDPYRADRWRAGDVINEDQ